MPSETAIPCSVCGNDFEPYRTSQRTCSRRCREKLPEARERIRSYFAREDVKERKNTVRRVAVNPDRRAVNLRANLRRYGLTVEQYEARLADQGGVCALCGRPPTPDGVRAASRLHVDHDHVTGAVRALLCNGCNRGIGYLSDDPELLLKASEYVRRHRTT